MKILDLTKKNTFSSHFRSTYVHANCRCKCNDAYLQWLVDFVLQAIVN